MTTDELMLRILGHLSFLTLNSNERAGHGYFDMSITFKDVHIEIPAKLLSSLQSLSLLQNLQESYSE